MNLSSRSFAAHKRQTRIPQTDPNTTPNSPFNSPSALASLSTVTTG